METKKRKREDLSLIFLDEDTPSTREKQTAIVVFCLFFMLKNKLSNKAMNNILELIQALQSKFFFY